jgi:glycosyltransferase involved in cell wall biosynthesis
MTYLERGHYYGIDVRPDVIEEARQELREAGLEHKAPVILQTPDLSRLRLDRTFDFMWAFSVLIHMTDEVLQKCLRFVGDHLDRQGRFYANVHVGDRPDGAWQGFPVVWRTRAFYEDAARAHGLEVTDLGPLRSFGHVSHFKRPREQRMLEFRPQGPPAPRAGTRKVLFYRNLCRFTGGHLKVWDYFNHVRHAAGCAPYIHFSKKSVWDERNPWLRLKAQIDTWNSITPDVLFLAGLDWSILDGPRRWRSRVPVINLIQHVRHADPDDPRFAFLKHRAIRICVSAEVASAIRETGCVNGPVFVIPNGIDRESFPEPHGESARDRDLLIAALKQPDLGRRLARRLRSPGRSITLLSSPVPRSEFVALMNRARVTLYLPHEREGFYLPALEGMAVQTVVVCPDCVGNRSFCVAGRTCLRPAYTEGALAEAVEAALALSGVERADMLAAAGATVARHDLGKERKAFLGILDNLSQLWRGAIHE